MAKFKKAEQYPEVANGENPGGTNAPVVREVFFRLKLMPAGLIQYAVEQVTIENDLVVERKNITERDILAITLSKIEQKLLEQVRR